MAKIIGSALPNIPWQEPPANTRTPFWRYDANPIIGRDGNARSNSVFNSAVVPFKDGFAGVFRCDSLSISMDIFAGFSKDGLHWDIEDTPIHLVGDDPEVTTREYRYDPRVCYMDGKYYVTWCNGYHGPTMALRGRMTSRHSTSWKMPSCRTTVTVSFSRARFRGAT